ncbi:MAG: thiosulfate oxidation carrier complex protein SoxZ [Methylomonas sp.]|jgi:sulfur-oxidizing protein SoxZ
MSSIKIRTEKLDVYTELRILITHPMENGRNRDPLSGDLIPAHFITELNILVNGQLVISADMGGSISKNPYFTLQLKDLKSGDRISVDWVDNLRLSDREDYLIK